MKAMILAAGRGKRMLSLTDHMPKPLLPFKNKPLIVHHLIALKKAGVTDIVINLHYLGDKIKVALGKGEAFGVNIAYSEEDPVLETGGGVAKALALLGEAPFIVLSSDIYTDFPFETLPKTLKGFAHLVLVDNPAHHPKGDFALVEGKVCETGPSLLNFGGIGVYHPTLFEGYPVGAFPLTTVLKPAIKQGLVTGEYYKGVWYNLGTPEQLADLED